MAKCFFLYGGEREMFRDGIQTLSFENALLRLPELFGIQLPSVVTRPS